MIYAVECLRQVQKYHQCDFLGIHSLQCFIRDHDVKSFTRMKLLITKWCWLRRLPIKFPWKRRVSGKFERQQKMADSRFAILMALFLPNKEFFPNFVMFNHAWKYEEDRWNYFQYHTKPNLRVATILAWFWWLRYHVNWKITSFSYSS